MHYGNSRAYGIKFLSKKKANFSFWAPDAKNVKLYIQNKDNTYSEFEMERDENSVYKATVNNVEKNSLYFYKIDDSFSVPDPASNYQPFDVFGPSQIIDHNKFDWENDHKWKGIEWKDSIIYEIHIGTFTKEGTFKAVEQKLDYLKDLGISAIELMPIGDFPGNRNWGYDGVLIYAPDSSYGTPDELKSLIKTAHKKGMAVYLDVVYNHFGPDGNFLYTYAKSKFFSDKHITPWGDGINFENKYVRNFFINNAIFWLTEYHFDGLRFDAAHAIYDDIKPDILTEISEKVRKKIGDKRKIHLILENDDNCTRYLDTTKKGYYDAQWNDDFHHCAHIFLTGEKDSYYKDYTSEETGKSTAYYMARTLAEGFAYQGEKSIYRNGAKRGNISKGLSPIRFIDFIQNHDQVGNRAFGERITQICKKEILNPIEYIYLLSPSIPLIFMGEEWGSSTPFYFFCNFNEELSKLVDLGRKEDIKKNRQNIEQKELKRIPVPSKIQTFTDSKLNWEDLSKKENNIVLEKYQNLIKTRKEKIIPIIDDIKETRFEVFDEHSFIVEWVLENKKYKKLILIANISKNELKRPFRTEKLELVATSSLANNIEIITPYTASWYLGEA